MIRVSVYKLNVFIKSGLSLTRTDRFDLSNARK
jgi:hypothetical protein